MKKFILSILLLGYAGLSYTAAPAVANPVHIPAVGPLQIGAVIPNNASSGIVMDIITRDPDFVTECDAIRNLLGLRPNQAITHTYQQVVTILNTAAINATIAIPALQAIEKAIMHKLHYDDYLLFSYNPWTSMFVTGIRASWFYPTTYLNPKNLINSTTPETEQLLSELDTIANIAGRHSTVMSLRLKATITSYRKWKKIIATIILTYLAGDLIAHEQNSAVKKIWDGGLCAIPDACQNVPNNMKAVGRGAYYAGDKAASIIRYFTGPVVQKILYGMNNGNTTTPPTQKPTQPTEQAPKKAAQNVAPAKQETQEPVKPVTIVTPKQQEPTQPVKPSNAPVQQPTNYNVVQPIKNSLIAAKDATLAYHKFLCDKYLAQETSGNANAA